MINLRDTLNAKLAEKEEDRNQISEILVDLAHHSVDAVSDFSQLGSGLIDAFFHNKFLIQR